MLLESIRQQVFILLDTNPTIPNKQIYSEFPLEKHDKLRSYKAQYFNEVSKVNFSLVSPETIETEFESDSESDSVRIARINKIKTDVKYSDLVKQKKLGKYHIFPLLKTFKLLPLYIMGKSKLYAENCNYANNCENNANSFTEIICLITDQINNGEYSLDDITDFSYNSYIKLEHIGFSHNIWAKNCIINSNSWLKLDHIIEMDKMKLITTKQKQEEYLKIKGKILIEYLPKFLAIFFYSRNKEDIVKDLVKACLYNNLSTNDPISLTQILEQYNDELGFLKRSDDYYIFLNYDEKDFLK